jgi:tetratricopeptide (TPR) repeat protein
MKTPRNTTRRCFPVPRWSTTRLEIRRQKQALPADGPPGRRARVSCRVALLFAGMFASSFSAFAGPPALSDRIHAETAQTKPSSNDSMRRHYDAAFRLQSEGRTAEADAEHKLFLAAALNRVADGRANIGEYALAAPVYEQAVQLSPRDFTLHLEYAEAALDAEDPAKAKVLAQEALALLPPTAGLHTEDPKRAHALYILARALWGTGDRRQSIEQYHAAAEMDPGFDNIYALGTTYLSLSNKAEAARIFARLLAKFGDTATVRMQIGRAYALATDYPEAVQEFKKALAKDNRMPGLHYSLGAATMQAEGEKGYAEAEVEFRKELVLQPQDPYSYPQLAHIALARRDYKQAEADLARADELDPGNPDTALKWAQLYTETGRLAEMQAALQKAIAETLNPSRNHYEIERAHYQLGRLMIQSGNIAEGKKEVQISQELLAQSRLQDESSLSGKPVVQAPLQRTHLTRPAEVAEEKRFEAQIAPAIASSYDNLGVHAAISKDFAVAAACFARAAEWNPTLSGIDGKWGRAAFAAREYASAVGPLGSEALARPEDAAIRGMLGISQYMSQDYLHALETLRPFADDPLDMFPMLPLAYADSMARAGDLAQGMKRLQRIVRNSPENPAAHHALAEAYRKNGQPREAEREESLSNSPQPQRPPAPNGPAPGENSSSTN